MNFFKRSHALFSKIPLILFGFSIFILIFSYGFVVAKYKIFPYSSLKAAIKVAKGFGNVAKGRKNWYYPETEHKNKLSVYKKNVADSALVLYCSLDKDNLLTVSVIDREGQLVHKWKLDWFEIWPDPSHLTEEEMPKSLPGTDIHGMALLDDGDLIFNYEDLGLVRVDICGNVVWRLPHRTHHSIYRDGDILWIPGGMTMNDTLYKNHNIVASSEIHSILKINLQGEILDEIDLVDLFEKNNLQGLLYLSNISVGGQLIVSGDIFHVNDIEVFPASMEEGIFKAGDIMVSVRNMNAIIVFNGEDYSVRYMTIGGTIRQHDPDFVDGNTISVFDNNRILTRDYKHKSRIVIISADSNQFHVYYEGDEKNPFFSDSYGNHQWLPNGNLLITETLKGRLFEIDTSGNIVWEYFNIVDDGHVGIVQESQRLPLQFTRTFFENQVRKCKVSE